MFTTKKKKIQQYLSAKKDADKSAFDLILYDYLDGTLKDALVSMNIKNVEIYVDWRDALKCIDIQGKYKKYYFNAQVYADEFSISFDLVEPDEDETYPLKSRNQLYGMITDTINTLE